MQDPTHQMRVLHYRKRFSILSETFIYAYITELERQGIEGHVLTHRQINSSTRPFPRVHVAPMPSQWHPRHFICRLAAKVGAAERHTYEWPLTRSQSQSIIDSVQPDVVHAHFGPEGVRISRIAQHLGIPLVVTFYGYDISSLPREVFWQQEYRNLWNLASAITVLSDEMRGSVLELGCPASKIQIVRLGRNLARFPYRPPKDRINSFVSVGRLTEKKGHLDTLKAVQEVVHVRKRPVKLRIIGEGHQRGKLLDYISAAGLNDYVTLTGALANEDVAQELRDADAFILCSRTAPDGNKEGTPTALVEAQAIGLPCVSTRHAGIPEMIPPENHVYLAEEGNVSEIAACIDRLMGAMPEELLRASRAGREKVEEDYNLTREVEKLRSLYNLVSSAS